MTTAYRRTCPECLAAEEQLLVKIQRYIKDNPGQNMDSIAEEFDVDVDQIFKWIDERRLVVSESALQRICENCGTTIARGRLCIQCGQSLSDPSSESGEDRSKKKPIPGMVNTRVARDKD
jgi:ribosomal protein L32